MYPNRFTVNPNRFSQWSQAKTSTKLLCWLSSSTLNGAEIPVGHTVESDLPQEGGT